MGRGPGIITFVVSEEFSGRVDGGSEGGNFEFMCVGKEVCTVLLRDFFFLFFRPNHPLHTIKFIPDSDMLFPYSYQNSIP